MSDNFEIQILKKSWMKNFAKIQKFVSFAISFVEDRSLYYSGRFLSIVNAGASNPRCFE